MKDFVLHVFAVMIFIVLAPITFILDFIVLVFSLGADFNFSLTAHLMELTIFRY